MLSFHHNYNIGFLDRVLTKDILPRDLTAKLYVLKPFLVCNHENLCIFFETFVVLSYFYPETLEFFDLRIRGIIVKSIVQIPHLKRAEVLKRKKTHMNYKKNKFAINVFATFTYKIP